MIVSFTVPDAIATELNAIAVKAGFANVKLMTAAYWKATIAGAREKVLRDAVPQVNTNDVVIS
jgi:predicted RecB family endonuclease